MIAMPVGDQCSHDLQVILGHDPGNMIDPYRQALTGINKDLLATTAH